MIIIHTRGNEKIGIGNLSRCFELVSHLSKKNEVIGIFECDRDLFKRYKINNIIRSDSLENSLKIIEEYEPITYICDLVDPNKQLSTDLKSIGIKTIMHLSGIEFGFEPDVLFVCDSFDYPYESEVIDIYRGFEYYIVGKNIIENRKKELTGIIEIKDILICFGGSDPAFFTEHFAETISDNTHNYKIVLGPAMNKKRKEYIKNIKKENIQYIDSPKDMTDLLLSSDLLITLGGMMTYEAMCLGVPVSAVRWNYLEYIVKSFGEENMVSDLGNIEEAYANIFKLDIKDINNRVKKSFDIIDGNALKNIELVIEKYEGKIND